MFKSTKTAKQITSVTNTFTNCNYVSKNVNQKLEKSGEKVVNPFSTNVSFMDEPGNWFLLVKGLKTPVEECHFK